MANAIRWNTPDGRRPKIYWLFTIYWKNSPPWVPFIAAALFSIFIWMSPLLPSIFGPEPNYAKTLTSEGYFGERRTIKSNYKFTDTGGKVLYLTCWPGMRVNDCLYGIAIPRDKLQIQYAPMNYSIFRAEDGVIEGVKRGSVVLLNPVSRKEHLTRKINKFDFINILLDVIMLIPLVVLLLVFILIVFGMVDGTRRMLSKPG